MQPKGMISARRVLVMCRSDPNNDPRPRRMIRSLASDHDVTALGTAPSRTPGVSSEILPEWPSRPRTKRLALLLLRHYEPLLWNAQLLQLAQGLAGERFDLVISHDLDLLPLAARIAGHGKLLFDAREFYPKHFENSWTWRLFYQPMNHYLCRTYLPRCHRVVTVSQGLADAYGEHYNTPATVLLSVPPYHDLQPSPVRDHAVRIVHHGNATSARRIEGMIEVMDHLPNSFGLDLILMPTDARYFKRLQVEAERRDNVRILPPLPYDELVPKTNEYDIGIVFCPPTTFNIRHGLPNKLFEFVQARLAVAGGPSPDMQRALRQYECGIYAEDFEPASMAAAIRNTSLAGLRRLKSQAHVAARELNAEVQSRAITDMVDQLFQSGTMNGSR